MAKKGWGMQEGGLGNRYQKTRQLCEIEKGLNTQKYPFKPPLENGVTQHLATFKIPRIVPKDVLSKVQQSSIEKKSPNHP